MPTTVNADVSIGVAIKERATPAECRPVPIAVQFPPDSENFFAVSLHSR